MQQRGYMLRNWVSIPWKVTIAAIVTYQAVLTYWLWRAAEWLAYIGSHSRIPFGDTGLGDPMGRALLGWGAALFLICGITAWLGGRASKVELATKASGRNA